MVIKRKRIHRIMIVFIVVIAFVVGSIAALTYGSKQNVGDTNGGDILSKLKDAEIGDGTAVISSQDLNSVLTIYQSGQFSKNGLKINKIGFDIKNDKTYVFISANFKSINLRISAQLAIGYTENYIRIIPENFKVGLIPLPRSFVMNRISGLSNDKVSVTSNYIDISKEIFPIKIDAVAIRNDKLMLMVKKQPEIKEILLKIDEFERKQKVSTSSGKKLETEMKNAKTFDEKREIILKGAIVQLDVASSKCKTAKEKELIDMAKRVITKMINDKSYPYMNELAKFKEFYGSMTTGEMKTVKKAILENVDTKALMKLNSMN